MLSLKESCLSALSGPEFKAGQGATLEKHAMMIVRQVAPFDWTPDVQLESFGSTRRGKIT